MKKVNVLGVLLITAFILLTCSCGTSKKATKPKKEENPMCNSLRVFTPSLSDSANRLPLNDLKTADFSLSKSIGIQRNATSSSLRIEGGKFIQTDSIEKKLRTFDYKTSVGHITTIPQKNPGQTTVQTYYIEFTNNATGVTHTFEFNLQGGSYVLNRRAKANYLGKSYDIIITYDPALNGQVGAVKLMVCFEHEVVVDEE